MSTGESSENDELLVKTELESAASETPETPEETEMFTIASIFSLKYMALAMLVLQNTLLILFMRYSRTVKSKDGNTDFYAATVAVTVMEAVKLLTCVLVITYETGSLGGFVKEFRRDIVDRPSELVKLAVPSFLYTVQNNLLYFALSNLDAATYQVGYQVC